MTRITSKAVIEARKEHGASQRISNFFRYTGWMASGAAALEIVTNLPLFIPLDRPVDR